MYDCEIDFVELPLVIGGKTYATFDGTANFENDPGYDPICTSITITSPEDRLESITVHDKCDDPFLKILFERLRNKVYKDSVLREYAEEEFGRMHDEERQWGYQEEDGR